MRTRFFKGWATFCKSDWILPRGTRDGKGSGREGKGNAGNVFIRVLSVCETSGSGSGVYSVCSNFFSNFSSLIIIMRSRVFCCHSRVERLVLSVLLLQPSAKGAWSSCILSDLSLVVGRRNI